MTELNVSNEKTTEKKKTNDEKEKKTTEEARQRSLEALNQRHILLSHSSYQKKGHLRLHFKEINWNHQQI